MRTYAVPQDSKYYCMSNNLHIHYINFINRKVLAVWKKKWKKFNFINFLKLIKLA